MPVNGCRFEGAPAEGRVRARQTAHNKDQRSDSSDDVQAVHGGKHIKERAVRIGREIESL